MFATMRRKRRSAIMKNELGQSVDHLKRAASLAAQETSATVGPKLTAARDRVQPAATRAKDAATSGWGSAVATLTPIAAAAAGNLRQGGELTKKQAKAQQKSAKKNSKKLERRANRALGRKQGGRKAGKLMGFALLGTAVGVGAAYLVRKKSAAQWDEYDPSTPVAVAPAEDAAFEPPVVTSTTPATTTTTTAVLGLDDAGDQTTSVLHSPEVARLANGGKSPKD